MRAAAYARVSSAMQREAQSIDHQLRVLPEFIARQGWQLVGIYADDGRSASVGKLGKREGWAALKAALAAGGIDVVVVVDVDRLTRSEGLRERGEIIGAIQDAGAKLASATTGQVLDLNSGAGDMLVSFQAVAAAEWVRQHRARVLRAHETAALHGTKPRGQTPYGYWYDRNTKAISEHPEHAAVVRELYRRVAAGESCIGVGRDLEARGIPGPRGPRWRANIPRMLRETYYRGEWVVDAARGHRITIPRLVDDDTWHAAQAAMARNARAGLAARTKRVYLCEGILRCAVCGSRVGIQGEGEKRRGQRSAYYHCLGRRLPAGGGPRCTLPMIQVREIDARVWAALAELLRRPDLAELLAARAGGGEDAAWDRDAAESRRQLDELQRAEEALLERFTRGLVGAPAMDAQLARIADRRRWLEGQAARAAGAALETRRRAQAAADAAQVVEALRARLDATTEIERRDLVRLLAPRITLRADRVLEIDAILAPWSGDTRKGLQASPAQEALALRIVA